MLHRLFAATVVGVLVLAFTSSAIPVDNNVDNNESHIAQQAATPTAKIDDDDDDQEESLVASLLMIAVSELGDKTFLIAAVMAMKHPRLAVFVGAFFPKQYTDIIAAVLFFFFGIRMTLEARRMKRQEEIQQRHCGNGHDEVEEEESKTELQQYMLPEEGDDDEEEHEEEKKKKRQQQPVLVEAFVLTFLGEWGDKSQISTIALAASNNVYWVASGVIVGHGICTALAVLGGRLIADRISVRTVTMVGAMMFIAFGIVYSHHAYRENSSTCTDIGCV